MRSQVHTAILCLTHRCNLNCVYCFENKDGNHELLYDTACQCVDEIIQEHCLKLKSALNLIFFGREPLLRLSL